MNFWKVSTFVLTGVVAAGIGYETTKTAQADEQHAGAEERDRRHRRRQQHRDEGEHERHREVHRPAGRAHGQVRRH